MLSFLELHGGVGSEGMVAHTLLFQGLLGNNAGLLLKMSAKQPGIVGYF